MPLDKEYRQYWDWKSVRWTHTNRKTDQQPRTQDQRAYYIGVRTPDGDGALVEIPQHRVTTILRDTPADAIEKLARTYSIPKKEAAGVIVQERARLAFHARLDDGHLPEVANAIATRDMINKSNRLEDPEAWAYFVRTVATFPKLPHRHQLELSAQARQRGKLPSRLVSPELLDACGIAYPPMEKAFTLAIDKHIQDQSPEISESYSFRPYFDWDDVVRGIQIQPPPILHTGERGWQWPAVIDQEIREANRTHRALALGSTLIGELKSQNVAIVEKTQPEFIRIAKERGLDPSATMYLNREETNISLVVPKPKKFLIQQLDRRDLYDNNRKMISLTSAFVSTISAVLDTKNKGENPYLETGLAYVLLSTVSKQPLDYQPLKIELEQANRLEESGQQLSLVAQFIDTKLDRRTRTIAESNGQPLTRSITYIAELDSYIAANKEAIKEINSTATPQPTEAQKLAKQVQKFQLAYSANPPGTPSWQIPETMSPSERLAQQTRTATNASASFTTDSHTGQSQDVEEIESPEM